MSTITTRKANYRIVLEVPEPNWGSVEDRAEEMKSQVERHVDYASKGRVNILHDVVCGHCGRDPEIDKEEGPCCCTPALNEWQSNKAKENL